MLQSPVGTMTENATPEKDKTSTITELVRWHGFWIALLLILSFMAILVIPVASGDYQEAKDLAGIFSGWIAAIIGFYFMQGQTQQAAAAARESGLEAGSGAVQTMKNALEDYKRRNEELEGKLEVLGAAYEEAVQE